MSPQTFEDVHELLVETYRLDTLAQLFSPEREPEFKTKDEQMKQLFEEFLEMVHELLKRKKTLSTKAGTLEWLDWIYRALDLESRLIAAVGEKSYNKYDQETRWFVEFAVDGMIEIIRRVQKWIKKEAGLFKKTRRDYLSLRQAVFVELSELTFSLFSIVFIIIEVEKGKSKPQELYSVVGESLYRTKHLR